MFGQPSIGSSSEKDSVQNQVNQPTLRVSGTRVYQGNSLLTKSEVLNIMGVYPKAASLYTKGKSMRGTGGFLIVGGIVTMTAGIVVIVDSYESYDVNGGYYTYSYSGFGDNYYLGLAITTIGELMLDGGIACSIVGKIQIKRSVRNFNASAQSAYRNPTGLQYQLGFLDNGNFGMRLTF
jgi:hypothetical protein